MSNIKQNFKCLNCSNFCAKIIIANPLAGFHINLGQEKCAINCRNNKNETIYHAPSDTNISICKNYKIKRN